MRQRARTHQRLSVFIERSGHGRAGKRSTLEVGTSAAQHFTPQRHGMSAELCTVANALLRKAQRERPLRGDMQQVHFRFACRCAGILSVVKRRLVGNAHFGYKLHGHRGGTRMRAHALAHLRQWSPIARLAAQLAREKRAAQEIWERTGESLPLGAQPTATMEQQRIQTLNDA